MMHTIRYGADGTYPRTPCGLKLGEDRFHYCGPPHLAAHCHRLGVEPCVTCWPDVVVPPPSPSLPAPSTKPPIAYYGGKTRLAPWIVSLFPSHRVYVEPFCGSAAVLFAKSPCAHEVINDIDGDVVNFYRLLRDRPDELERVCRLTPYSREEFEMAELVDPALGDLERARRWWVRSSQSFGQVAKANTGWSTSVDRGSNNARSVWNRLDRFVAAAHRLGPVTIENMDALECIEKYDASDGIMYVDPPYLGSTRTSIADGRRPGGDYWAEFHTDDQHRALAEVLCAVQATVFVSGYPSALYGELFQGWYQAHRVVTKHVSNGRAERRPTATEVIWSNRPIVDRLDLWGVGA